MNEIRNTLIGTYEFDKEQQILYVHLPQGKVQFGLPNSDNVDYTDPDIQKKIKRDQRSIKLLKIFADES